jgi:hypothetical protein
VSEIVAVNKFDRHDRLVPILLRQLIETTTNEAEAMVVLESLTLGVMLYYRPDPRQAGEFMDSMTAAIIERMKK